MAIPLYCACCVTHQFHCKSNKKCKGYMQRPLGNKNSLPVSLKTSPESLVLIKLASDMPRF